MKALILTIATAALLSITSFVSAADAGGIRRHNFKGQNHFAVLRRAELAEARRAKYAKARKARIAAAKRAKAAKIRKAKIAAAKRAKIAAIKKAKIAKMKRIAAQKRRAAAKEMVVAEAETTAVDIVDEDKFEDKIVVAEADTDAALDCKKFIPSAGMTISVPCKD
ncbi:MAG: hypothetical protein ACRBCJ_00440 [Hyphomicrobiaceae bacterium]